MTNEVTDAVPASRARLERSRRDRVLGGVCAGIAQSLGLDSLLLRVAAVVLVLVSGGMAILAYLVAWIVIPPAAAEQVPPPLRPRSAAKNGVRGAWTAAGGDLRSLAAELRAARPDRQGVPHSVAEAAEPQHRSKAVAVDAAMTAMGDRLRAPEVRASARRAAAGLSMAVGASVEDLGRRGRRGPPTTGAGPAG